MIQSKNLTMQSKGCKDCWFREGKFCTYFIYKKQEKKEIPEKVIARGCKFYVHTDDMHPLFKQIMELFDGELI